MNLLIISHTEHYLKENKIVGWNPTIREIDHLSTVFKKVTHLAPLHKSKSPGSSISYSSSNLVFRSLSPSGGDGIWNKILILIYAVPNLIKINSECRKADMIHFRAPTNLGVYTLPFLWFYRKKIQWVKYAGNWMQKNKPWSYSFQKWWIEKNFNKGIATINGKWENQKKDIFTFENPCLSIQEYNNAKKVKKEWSGKLIICFAAALNSGKGPFKIIEAMNKIPEAKNYFEKIIFAGDGEEKEKILNAKCDVTIEVKGFLNKEDLFKVYSQSHIVLLPTQNEGFPKTIAEAMAFGCIPVVTDVSCIGQYVINNINGFLLPENSVEQIAIKLDEIKNISRNILKAMSEKAMEISELFTYEHYLSKLKAIFNL